MSLILKSTHFGAVRRVPKQYLPATFIHSSSIAYRENVSDKSNKVTDFVHRKVGETVSNAVKKGACHKAEELKKEAFGAAETIKNTANSVNKDLGKRVGEGIDAAKNAVDSASKKVEGSLEGKNIVEAFQDGVKTVENVLEETKKAVGLKK